MINTLQFNLSVPTPYVFMRRFLKAAQSDKRVGLYSNILVFFPFLFIKRSNFGGSHVCFTDHLKKWLSLFWKLKLVGAGIVLHSRALPRSIRDAQVPTFLASSSCHLHSSMHTQWVQAMEQDMREAHVLQQRTAIVSGSFFPPTRFTTQKQNRMKVWSLLCILRVL